MCMGMNFYQIRSPKSIRPMSKFRSRICSNVSVVTYMAIIVITRAISTEYFSLVLNFNVESKRHSEEYCIVYNLSDIAISVAVGGVKCM